MLERRIGRRAFLSLAVGGLAAACSGDSGLPPASPPRPPPALGKDTLLLADGPSLYLQAPSGETEILRLEPGYFILDPAANAERIAFAIQPPSARRDDGSIDFGSDLYAASRAGGEAQLLVRHAEIAEFVRSPGWLGTDRMVFDVRGRHADGSADLRLEMLDIPGSRRTRFLDDAVSPCVSPDGRTIACVRIDPETGQEDILLVDPQTADSTSLLGDSSTKLYIGALTWSPDGARLAFGAADPLVSLPTRRGAAPRVSLNHPTLRDVWLIERDGTNLHRLADLAEGQLSLAWSSDPRYLYALGFQGLLRLDVETGAQEVLGEGSLGGQIALLPE